jgi:hypothetical protein
MFVRLTMAALLTALTLSTAQARMASVPILVPERVVLQRMDGQPSTPDLVRKAILTGSQPFGWKLLGDQPGALTISYTKKDGPTASVRITYDDKSYQINYLSSDYLSYDGNGNNATIHPTYNMWVKNLVQRIMLPGELVPASAVTPAVMPAASR